MTGHKPWSEIKHKRDQSKPADTPPEKDDLGNQRTFETMAARTTPGTPPRVNNEDRRNTEHGEDRRNEPKLVSTHWNRKQADDAHMILSTQYAGRSSGGRMIKYRVDKRPGFHLKRYGVYSS